MVVPCVPGFSGRSTTIIKGLNVCKLKVGKTSKLSLHHYITVYIVPKYFLSEKSTHCLLKVSMQVTTKLSISTNSLQV